MTAGWTEQSQGAKLHIVTGKGGAGKTTIAASLALALADQGREVLLIEVEQRQAIARLFDRQPLPYQETRIALPRGGGQVRALAVDVEAALLEYFALFYNLGLAGRSLKKLGAIEFATTLAPGLRDVLLTGKVKETVTRTDPARGPLYDAVVLDAPPTGRIGTFLNVTAAMADLAKRGPIHAQAEGVASLLRSKQTVVHIVTLLQELPVTETLEAVDGLRELGFAVGSVIVNAVTDPLLPSDAMTQAADDGLCPDTVAAQMLDAGLVLDRQVLMKLLDQAKTHAQQMEREYGLEQQLVNADLSMLNLPLLTEGVDLGGLYQLADMLSEQGVGQ